MKPEAWPDGARYLDSTYHGSYSQWEKLTEIEKQTHAHESRARELTTQLHTTTLHTYNNNGATVITDKVVTITTNQGDYTLTLTGQQIEQTLRRRMNTLAPGARILDMHEVVVEQQPDLLTPTRKAK